MKIKTITCHRVYNYGASLQAYALQRKLEMMGHDVEIINFLPYFLRSRYNLFYVPESSKFYAFSRFFPPLGLLYKLKAKLGMFKTIGRKYSFDRFQSEFLHVGQTYYPDSKSLQVNPPQADMYIAGSDQIWNTDMQNGHELAYYMDFGDQSICRCTYAASFGISVLPNEYSDFVRGKVHKIDCVSVREKSGLAILKGIGRADAVKVLDPVFLLDKTEWANTVASKAKRYISLPERYILLYEFCRDLQIRDFAQEASRITGWPIVSINDGLTHRYADMNINDAGPAEFVSLLSEAEMVITNSFHATAFSIIFQKEFYAFSLNSQRTSSRISELLDSFGIKGRFNSNDLSDDLLDYDQITNNLFVQISESGAYLNDITNGPKNMGNAMTDSIHEF